MASNLLLAVSSFISEGSDPSTMSSHSFSTAHWETQLLTSSLPALRSSWRSCWMSSPSSDVAALISFGPLFHCCIPGASVVPSWEFIL
jgi:hypothetical protein